MGLSKINFKIYIKNKKDVCLSLYFISAVWIAHGQQQWSHILPSLLICEVVAWGKGMWSLGDQHCASREEARDCWRIKPGCWTAPSHVTTATIMRVELLAELLAWGLRCSKRANTLVEQYRRWLGLSVFRCSRVYSADPSRMGMCGSRLAGGNAGPGLDRAEWTYWSPVDARPSVFVLSKHIWSQVKHRFGGVRKLMLFRC